MKIALQIILYIMTIFFGIGSAGEQDPRKRPFYVIVFVLMILLILLVNKYY